MTYSINKAFLKNLLYAEWSCIIPDAKFYAKTSFMTINIYLTATLISIFISVSLFCFTPAPQKNP